MISVIRQFHDDGMRACVRLNDRVCSEWFAVEQGLRQGCVLVRPSCSTSNSKMNTNILYNFINCHARVFKGCKYKTSSWHLARFPDADNIGSTV